MFLTLNYHTRTRAYQPRAAVSEDAAVVDGIQFPSSAKANSLTRRNTLMGLQKVMFSLSAAVNARLYLLSLGDENLSTLKSHSMDLSLQANEMSCPCTTSEPSV